MTKTQQIYQNQYQELMEKKKNNGRTTRREALLCVCTHTRAPSVMPAHSLCRGVTASLLLLHGQNTAIRFEAEPQVFL